MLVKCPRCGFSQPQDQYCAQCGVDMTSYRPPQKSAMKKFVGNPVLQIGFVLLVAGAIGSTLYRKGQRDLDDRVRYLQGGAQVARSVSSPGSAGTSELEDAVGASVPVAASMSPPTADSLAGGAVPTAAPAEAAALAPKTASDTAAVETKDAASKSAKESQAATKTQGAYVVRVYYAEVARAALDQLSDESRGTGQFNKLGDYSAGILPSLEKVLSPSNRDVKVLHRETRGIDPGQSVQWFLGAHANDPDLETGLTTFVELLEGDGTNFRGNLEVLRSWRDANEGPGSQKSSYPAVFELQRSAGFFMTGVLPRRASLEDVQDIGTIPPFDIFRSPQYTGFGTEFVLFLEFDRP